MLLLIYSLWNLHKASGGTGRKRAAVTQVWVISRWLSCSLMWSGTSVSSSGGDIWLNLPWEAGWFSEWMRPGYWSLWSRLFSPIFLLNFLLCVSLCLILPASSSSLLSSILFCCLEEELLCLLPFPFFFCSFQPLSLFLLFFLFCLVLPFLPCFLLLHVHPILSFQLSVTLCFFIFLCVPLSFYISFFPLFSIFILPPHESLLSPFLFLSHHLLLSSKLCFPVLPSCLPFCLYPHFSPFLLLCSPSVFVLAVLAYSAGSNSCDANYIDWKKGGI